MRIFAMSRCERNALTLFLQRFLVSDQTQAIAAIEGIHGEEETKDERQGKIGSEGETCSQEECACMGG